MSWEAFLGALLPGLIAALASFAAYYRAHLTEAKVVQVEGKLDENTTLTEQIGRQTNGIFIALRTELAETKESLQKAVAELKALRKVP